MYDVERVRGPNPDLIRAAPPAVLAGLATTPAMFMSTVLPECGFDAAVMITASHLPPNRNGFKFFRRDGGLDKKGIKDILQIATQGKSKGPRGPESRARLGPPETIRDARLVSWCAYVCSV